MNEPSAASNPNRIELKNLLRQAETELSSEGLSTKDIIKTLRPAKEMLENTEFWAARQIGLSLFMHKNYFAYFHIPDVEIPHLASVGKGFNLEPLESILKDNKKYFVLALSHKNVHLYEGDHYHLNQVELENFPSDLKEALGIDELQNEWQTHPISPAGNKGSEAFHGQYNAKQTDKDMLLEFFRRIDTRLKGFLHQKRAPLVLAGVEYLLPIYRQANTYPDLLDQSIKGNQEHEDLRSIRSKAWTLVSAQ